MEDLIKRLEDCPFCGGTESDDNAVQEPMVYTTERTGPMGRYYKTICVCGCEGRGFESIHAAENWWNTRK